MKPDYPRQAAAFGVTERLGLAGLTRDCVLGGRGRDASIASSSGDMVLSKAHSNSWTFERYQRGGDQPSWPSLALTPLKQVHLAQAFSTPNSYFNLLKKKKWDSYNTTVKKMGDAEVVVCAVEAWLHSCCAVLGFSWLFRPTQMQTHRA